MIEKQKADAAILSVTVTAVSTALSLLPSDTASPIADEIADLSLPLFLIVCILTLEKFLLPTFGWITTTFLIPSICCLMTIYILTNKQGCLIWAKKLSIIALVLLLLIPTSAKITSLIETAFSESISQTLNAAHQLAEETGSSSEEATNAFVAFFTGLKDDIVGLVDAAKGMLSIIVDAIAVLFITSCAIPILTTLAFLWILKNLLNANIPIDFVASKLIPSRKKSQNPSDAE